MTSILKRVALVLGLAIAAVLTWIRRIDNTTPTSPVVVAARDIAENEQIDEKSVAIAQWPVSTAPADAFRNKSSVVGRSAHIAYYKGEPIRIGRIGAPRDFPYGIRNYDIRPTRAMSVRVFDSGAPGYITPNSHVDVLVVPNGQKGLRIATVVAQNVRVLALNRVPSSPVKGNAASAVATLDVTLEQGDRIAVASSEGAMIQLLLIGYSDGGAATDARRRMRMPPGARPDTFTVVIFRGTVRSDSARRFP